MVRGALKRGAPDDGAACTMALPRLATRSDRTGRLRTLPRGIPNPAVPWVIITRREPAPEPVPPEPTITVGCPPVAGACGGAKRFGGLTAAGTVFQALQPPGCQAQP